MIRSMRAIRLTHSGRVVHLHLSLATFLVQLAQRVRIYTRWHGSTSAVLMTTYQAQLIYAVRCVNFIRLLKSVTRERDLGRAVATMPREPVARVLCTCV